MQILFFFRILFLIAPKVLFMCHSKTIIKTPDGLLNMTCFES